MNENYDIYFATNRLAISSSHIEGITTTISAQEATSADEICRMLNTHNNIAIITPNTEECFDKISSLFTKVTAAGGLTSNNKGEYLMIYRNGRWDLPKGHWEQGETIEECAIREVEEETGVKGITLGDKICHTIHIYKMKGRWEIKQTHWYSMHTTFNQELTPQLEEGIMQVKWCSKDNIRHSLPNSYPTIQQVFKEAKVL